MAHTIFERHRKAQEAHAVPAMHTSLCTSGALSAGALRPACEDLPHAHLGGVAGLEEVRVVQLGGLLDDAPDVLQGAGEDDDERAPVNAGNNVLQSRGSGQVDRADGTHVQHEALQPFLLDIGLDLLAEPARVAEPERGTDAEDLHGRGQRGGASLLEAQRCAGALAMRRYHAFILHLAGLAPHLHDAQPARAEDEDEEGERHGGEDALDHAEEGGCEEGDREREKIRDATRPEPHELANYLPVDQRDDGDEKNHIQHRVRHHREGRRGHVDETQRHEHGHEERHLRHGAGVQGAAAETAGGDEAAGNGAGHVRKPERNEVEGHRNGVAVPVGIKFGVGHMLQEGDGGKQHGVNQHATHRQLCLWDNKGWVETRQCGLDIADHLHVRAIRHVLLLHGLPAAQPPAEEDAEEHEEEHGGRRDGEQPGPGPGAGLQRAGGFFLQLGEDEEYDDADHADGGSRPVHVFQL
mmetsp:Transcript_128363/g.363238  ORF Transcript_128363/g.363238 Transcript_128363/m.363238 type:complete len:467 (+) Transcript_128363:538-1938(+)